LSGFRQPFVAVAERFDVAVIGAGIAGITSARALAAAGRRVLVLERAEPWSEASGASAGMLAPQVEAHAGDALLPLGLAARDRYAALATECLAAGFDIGYAPRGILHVVFDEKREDELKRRHDAQRALGLDTAWLYAKELHRLYPGLAAGARGALLAPRDGSVDSIALGAALLAAAKEAGVALRQEEVCEISSRGGRVTGVHGSIAHYEARHVVLAAGAWACTIAGAPRNIPVEPVRGQMASLPWPKGERASVLYGDAGYLVPRGDDALVGSTMEHVGFEKGNTDEGIATLRRAAETMLPALKGQPFTRTWSGLRPMTPDGLPILGFDPDLDGLVYATGHGRNGILLGPLTGDIVRDLVVRGTTAWNLAPYSITRF
jgi:glycine oxidase